MRSAGPYDADGARAILAAAFPDTPWIWVQRDPVRVLASLLAKPPGWLGLQAAPPRAARLFGLDPAAVAAMTRAEFAARALGAMLEAAAADPVRRLSIDYADLPAAVWQRWPHGSMPGIQYPGSLPATPRSGAR